MNSREYLADDLDSRTYPTFAWMHDLPRRSVAKRQTAARRSYGLRAESLLMPHTEPLAVRTRGAELIDPDKKRRSHVRRLVQDIETARHRGIWRSRATRRLFMHGAGAGSDAEIQDAHSVIAHYELITERAEVIAPLRVSDVAAAQPLVGGWVGATIAAAGMSFIGPASTGQTIARIAAPTLLLGILIYLALNFGWRWGYNQATWHIAEVVAYNTTEVAAVQEQQAASHAEELLQLRTLLNRQEARHALAIQQRDQEYRRRDAEQAAIRDADRSRRMAFRLPPKPRGEGYLYVVEFSTGTVKVGMTEDAKRRMSQHAWEAQAFGVHITNYWISPSHKDFRANEARLISHCARTSRRTRKEYFHAIAYIDAVQFAAGLTYRTKNVDQTSIEGMWA